MSEEDWDQKATDLETVRAHLDRGTQPLSGHRMWGGLEWAMARLLGEYPEGVQPLREAPYWYQPLTVAVEDTPIYWAVLYGKKDV